MSARVLVVDDVLPNVKVLEAKLTSEYFDVITASGGEEALARVYRDSPDIILLDVMMPGMNGFEVCRKIKADPLVAHIPIVMVTALSEPRDRVEGLEAGADDFLTKPVNDTALFARVRSLVRLKMMMDELRLREQTGNDFGVIDGGGTESSESDKGARILVVDEGQRDINKVTETLSDTHEVLVEHDAEGTLQRAGVGDLDLIIVSLAATAFDPLRLCVQLRNNEVTRQLPILSLVEETDTERLAKGLEIGVTDYLVRPVDRNELKARVRTQVRRKRFQDRLRSNYHESMAMAVTDGLTGLYNRRYFESHLMNAVSTVQDGNKSLSLLMMDIDHFKQINDTYGHNVGDEVLRELGVRILDSVRGVDLAARYGGEEFVVLLPDTGLGVAVNVAERLRRRIGSEPFGVSTDGGSLPVTCSVGVTSCEPGEDALALVKRADQALYSAKNSGRNRVVVIDTNGSEISHSYTAVSA